MTELGFDGRVAVVTGGGRGIGRAYARLLAARGARVVVNDLGGSMRGDGTDAAPASAVADEIVAAGGTAVADHGDVSTPEGAAALVAATIERFGRVDALLCNAGIIRWAGFPEADADNLARHLAVHVGGSFHTVRAAWPHMVAQRYGRIVLTTSSGVFGLPNNVSYATAKAAVIGLARSLATAGAAHDVKVNLIAPAAYTRMAGQRSDAHADEAVSPVAAAMSPERVAPMAAFLAHESCPVSGEIYAAGAGRFARIVLAQAHGWVQREREATIEDVAGNWAAINDAATSFVPADLPQWSSEFLSHLPRA